MARIVHGAVLVGRAGVVGQLHDPVEQFLGRGPNCATVVFSGSATRGLSTFMKIKIK